MVDIELRINGVTMDTQSFDDPQLLRDWVKNSCVYAWESDPSDKVSFTISESCDGILGGTNFSYMFNPTVANLVAVENAYKINTSNATDMSGMFSYSNIEELDLTGWDTSNVTKMNDMFSGCTKLTDITGLDGFNTSSVTTMSNMFSDCAALKTIDLSTFDMSNVTNTSYMFQYDSQLNSLTVNRFGWYDESGYTPLPNVTNSTSMYDSCTALGASASGTNKNTSVNLSIVEQPLPGGTVTLHYVVIWEDEYNNDGVRPESIIVDLCADGTVIDNRVISAADDWEYYFEDLPAGATYTAATRTFSEYDVTDEVYTDEDNVLVRATATHTPAKIDYTISVEWDDDNDNDGIRPAGVQVKLLTDGVAGDIVTLNFSNDWSHTFTNLYKYAQGLEITYGATVNGEYEGYDFSNSEIEESYTTFTGEHEPETITGATVTCVWEDEDDADGLRPHFVLVDVLVNGEVDSSIVGPMPQEPDWAAAPPNPLKKYKQGQLITYTYALQSVPTGYTAEVDGTTITLTHEVTPGPTPSESHFIGAAKFVSTGNDIAAMYAEGIKLL